MVWDKHQNKWIDCGSMSVIGRVRTEAPKTSQTNNGIADPDVILPGQMVWFESLSKWIPAEDVEGEDSLPGVGEASASIDYLMDMDR